MSKYRSKKKSEGSEDFSNLGMKVVLTGAKHKKQTHPPLHQSSPLTLDLWLTTTLMAHRFALLMDGRANSLTTPSSCIDSAV